MEPVLVGGERSLALHLDAVGVEHRERDAVPLLTDVRELVRAHRRLLLGALSLAAAAVLLTTTLASTPGALAVVVLGCQAERSHESVAPGVGQPTAERLRDGGALAFRPEDGAGGLDPLPGVRDARADRVPAAASLVDRLHVRDAVRGERVTDGANDRTEVRVLVAEVRILRVLRDGAELALRLRERCVEIRRGLRGQHHATSAGSVRSRTSLYSRTERVARSDILQPAHG